MCCDESAHNGYVNQPTFGLWYNVLSPLMLVVVSKVKLILELAFNQEFTGDFPP